MAAPHNTSGPSIGTRAGAWPTCNRAALSFQHMPLDQYQIAQTGKHHQGNSTQQQGAGLKPA